MVIEVARETDGRWIAEIAEIPGALAYGRSRREAIARAKALALRAIADRSLASPVASRSYTSNGPHGSGLDIFY